MSASDAEMEHVPSFAAMVAGSMTKYSAPSIRALVRVLHGVSRSLGHCGSGACRRKGSVCPQLR